MRKNNRSDSPGVANALAAAFASSPPLAVATYTPAPNSSPRAESSGPARRGAAPTTRRAESRNRGGRCGSRDGWLRGGPVFATAETPAPRTPVALPRGTSRAPSCGRKASTRRTRSRRPATSSTKLARSEVAARPTARWRTALSPLRGGGYSRWSPTRRVRRSRAARGRGPCSCMVMCCSSMGAPGSHIRRHRREE